MSLPCDVVSSPTAHKTHLRAGLDHSAAITEEESKFGSFFSLYFYHSKGCKLSRFKWYHGSYDEKEGSPGTFSSSTEPPNQTQPFQLSFLKFASIFLNAVLTRLLKNVAVLEHLGGSVAKRLPSA